MNKPIELDVLLDIVTGNIVSERQHQGALRTLLAGEPGAWRTVNQIDIAHTIAAHCLFYSQALGPKVTDGLRITWTPNPDSVNTEEDSFCTIWFYYARDGLLWHNVALFNRSTL